MHPPSPRGVCETEVLQGDPESPNPSPGGSTQAVHTLSKCLWYKLQHQEAAGPWTWTRMITAALKPELLSPEGQVLLGPLPSPLRNQAQGSFWHSAVSGGPPATHTNWEQQLAGAGASPTHVHTGTQSQKLQAQRAQTGRLPLFVFLTRSTELQISLFTRRMPSASASPSTTSLVLWGAT